MLETTIRLPSMSLAERPKRAEMGFKKWKIKKNSNGQRVLNDS
jgi:hypothetical protein